MSPGCVLYSKAYDVIMWYKSHCRKPEQLTWRQAHRWHGDKGLVNLIELLSSHTSTTKGSSPLRRGMKCG